MSDAYLTPPSRERTSGELDPLARPLLTRREVLLDWLAGQPLVPPAVGLILGIVIDAARAVPLAIVIFVFGTAGAVVFFARNRDGLRHLALLLAALALGAVLHDRAFRRWPANHVVRYCGAESTLARLTGTVIAAPALRPAVSGQIGWFGQLPRTRLLVEAETIEGVTGDIAVSGIVVVHVREPALHVAAGDRVELFGRLYRPPPPVNPGTRDWALMLRRDRILVEMACEHAANVVAHDTADRPRRWLARLRQRALAAMLDETFPGDVPGSQLLAAMVLGQRSAVDPELNDLFVRTGTVHYLSVSGAHVGMLMSAVWLVGLAVGSARRSCAVWAMIAVTAYAVLAEPRPPILRAAVMADLFCLAILLRRPVRSANWLALAAIILLVIDPMQLFMTGFQLSFLTVAVIICLSPVVYDAGRRLVDRALHRDDPLLMPAIQRRLHEPSTFRNIANQTVSILGWWLAFVVSAWLVSLLLSAYHFQRIAAWGWLNNFVVFPLIWLTQVVGLAKTVLTAVCPPMASVPGALLAGLTDALIALVSLLARLPGSGTATPEMPGWLVIAGLGVLTLWVVAPWLRVRGRWVAGAAAVFIALAAWRLAPAGDSDVLRLDVLAVGDGTACVINLPNGNTLIYDIGASPPYDLERWTVGPLLARRRVYHVDAVIISHPNLDHYGGLPELIDRRSVGQVIAAPHFEHLSEPGDASGRLPAHVEREGIPWHTMVCGDTLRDTGDVDIEVLWPPPLDELDIARSNDSSIVLSVTYAGCRVLLCGDIQTVAQRELIARGNLEADVLVLPHHGGVVGNTGAFIEAVNPTWCIRSSGELDIHTDNGLLELVAGRRYLNTADDGAVQVRITPSGLDVRPFRGRDN